MIHNRTASTEKIAARFRLAFPLVLIAAAVLGGCATLEAPSSGGTSSLLIGQLKLDVSGVGEAPNGASGLINAYYPAGAIITIVNVSDGTRYDAETLAPGNLFSVANLKSGQYELVEFQCQVQTSNAPINLETTFNTSPVFEVKDGQVTNLGVVLWHVDFDLSDSRALASFTQVGGGDAVVNHAFSLTNRESPWLNYRNESAMISGDAQT
ncbi:MAG: hypothetical protein WB384_15865, partial [Candidatus Sulfotelmatobacter sp.]